MTGTDWRSSAACHGVDPDLFFPKEGTGCNAGKEAKAICATCPVRAECLEHALGFSESYDHGVWGGTSWSERRRIRQQQRAAA